MDWKRKKDEGYLVTLGTVMKFLRESVKLKVSNDTIDYVTRLRIRREKLPILVKFASFAVKLEALRNTKDLAGSQIQVDGFAFETRRKNLIPYLKAAKEFGLRTFLKNDKSEMNGQLFHLDYLETNVQLGVAGSGLDSTEMVSVEGMAVTSKQRPGNECYIRLNESREVAIRK